MSSAGHIAVPRRYYICRYCRVKQTPWESWAGVSGTHRITPHARRMVVLAGSGCSFDEAARNLKELAHLQVSNDVVRRVCDEEGRAVQKWMNQSPEPKKAFDAAEGVVEFSTDGLKINTVDGWREIRMSVLGRRTPALPASAGQWDTRVLEPPTVRMAICAIAPSHVVGAGWKRLAGRLGLSVHTDLSAIADGAKWIWTEVAKRFPGPNVAWVVDVYHVMLYLHAAAATLGPDAARQWVHARVIELIEMGGPSFIEHLNNLGPPAVNNLGPPDPSSRAADAWCKLLNYLTDNRDSLWYGQRLQEGLPIGSGLIEGGAKNTLARRLKINSARWRVRRAERMAAIRCLQYSGMWETYWNSKQAA